MRNKRNKLILGVLFVFLSFPSTGYAQDYIIKRDNDTLFCKIIEVENNWLIWYKIHEKKNWIKIEDVAEYNMDGKKYTISEQQGKKTTATDIKGNKNKTAGGELMIASRDFYTGFGLMIFGGVILGVSQGQLGVIYMGVLMEVAGTGLVLDAWSHINNAGKILKQKGL